MKLGNQIAVLIERLHAVKELEELHAAYCENVCAKFARGMNAKRHTPRCERLSADYGFAQVALDTVVRD